MKMQVHHALTTVYTAVVDNAEAILKALRLCDLCDRLKTFRNVYRVFAVDIQSAGDMLLRHDEDMDGSLGIDVAESKNIIVLIDLIAGDLPSEDCAENTIVQHHEILLSDFFGKVFFNSGKRVIEFGKIRAAAHGGIGLAASTAGNDRSDSLDDIPGANTVAYGVFTADALQRDFIAVDGVLTDEFVVKKLSEINDENSEYYYELIQERIDKLILSDENEREYRDTKKAIDKIKSDIAAQIRNMRDAPDDIKPFYQEDIYSLKDELEKQQTVLVKIEALKNESRDLEEELKQVRKTLLSFEEYAKDATPEVLTSLIHSVVEKIYVTTESSERVCHIFIKGCTEEDYSDLFENDENADSKRLSEDCTNTCDDNVDCKRDSYLCGDPAQA